MKHICWSEKKSFLSYILKRYNKGFKTEGSFNFNYSVNQLLQPLKILEYLQPEPSSPTWSHTRTFITFSVDTGDVPGSRSGTTGTFGWDARSLLLDLPQVAGGMVAGDGLEQVRAGSLQGGVRLPQHVSPALSETWQWQGADIFRWASSFFHHRTTARGQKREKEKRWSMSQKSTLEYKKWTFLNWFGFPCIKFVQSEMFKTLYLEVIY